MAETTSAAADVIIPLTVDTGGADQSLDQLDNKVKALVATLATLTTANAEYYKIQAEIIQATSAATAANEKFDSTLSSVSKSGKKFSDDAKVMSENITAAADGTVSLSDSLNKTFTELQQSGESAKEAAQGTEWYKQTLEALREEGGLTNVTLNELKASQKELEKAMSDTQVGSDEWRQYRDDLNEVKQAQTDYKNLARDTEGEMKVQTNTIAGMRQEVSRLTKEWANTDMGSPQFAELSENLAKATEELKVHEMAVGKNQRDVGNYAGQIKEIIPQFTQLGEGMGLLGPVGQIAAKGVKGVSTAFKALMANPIVGFFAALVVGVKAFVDITDKLATKAAEKFTQRISMETAELRINSDELAHNLNLLKARGATANEMADAELTAAIKMANDAREVYAKFLDEYEGRGLFARIFGIGKGADKQKKEALDQLKKDADEASDAVTEAFKKQEITRESESTRAAKKAAEDRVAAQEKAAAELAAVEAEVTTALSDEFANRRAVEDKEYAERLAILQKNGQSTEDLERLHQQNLTQIQKDEEAKRSADAAAAVAKQLSDQDAAHKAELDALNVRNAEREAAQAEIQARLLEAEALGDEEARAAAQARLEEYKLLDEEAEVLQHEKELEDLQTRIALLQEGLANEQIIGEERIALERQVQDAKNELDITAATRAKALADKQFKDYKAQIDAQKKLDDEAAKQKAKNQAIINATIQSGIDAAGEGTVAAKVLNTAQAVMSTWAGAAQALNNPFPYNLAAMAATLATGFISIKKIWDVKVPGSSGASPDMSTADIAEVKSLQPIAAYQAPIVETHSNMTGDEIDEINKAQKVYVTENDISNTQTRVAVVESEATF